MAVLIVTIAPTAECDLGSSHAAVSHATARSL